MLKKFKIKNKKKQNRIQINKTLNNLQKMKMLNFKGKYFEQDLFSFNEEKFGIVVTNPN